MTGEPTHSTRWELRLTELEGGFLKTRAVLRLPPSFKTINQVIKFRDEKMMWNSEIWKVNTTLIDHGVSE